MTHSAEDQGFSSGHPNGHSKGHPESAGHFSSKNELRLVAWETTRNCNLSCVHCRASATCGPYTGELGTDDAFTLLEQIAETGKPIVILTGGEPLLRADIFDIAKYGTKLGLRMVMAPNGTLVTDEVAKRLKDVGIQRISISIDGATANQHDTFRGVAGAYDGAMNGIRAAKNANMEFQINTTITQLNRGQIPDILALAENIGAAALHIFLLVPTGRGKYIVDQAISAQEYEDTLNWFYDQKQKTSLGLKATCAPHYYRILRQRARKEGRQVTFQTHGLDAVTRGCLGGTGFCFVSHTGIVQPCGFLDLNCGDVTKTSFAEIWHNSEVFNSLRNIDNYKGKCGICQFRRVCGGCRARAYEATGDFLEEEPLCSYNP